MLQNLSHIDSFDKSFKLSINAFPYYFFKISNCYTGFALTIFIRPCLVVFVPKNTLKETALENLFKNDKIT